MSIDKHALLKGHYLFRDLDDATLDRVAALGVGRRLGRGETLFLKGDEGDALYGVLAGEVRISASSASGKEVILNVMNEGDVFGEIALLDAGPRTADAIALGPVELLMIRRRDFRHLLEREARLAIHLLELVCERVRWQSTQIEDAAFLSLPARLAKRLLTTAEVQGEPVAEGVHFSFPLSQGELAQMLGTARESVNRHLQSWRRDGLIDFGRGWVLIRDQDALEEIVESDGDDL